MAVELSWNNLRPHDADRRYAIEELCCQPTRVKPMPALMAQLQEHESDLLGQNDVLRRQNETQPSGRGILSVRLMNGEIVI